MSIKIITNRHWKELEYNAPEWDSENIQGCFKYRGETYFLDEFMRTEGYLKDIGFDGYHSDSFFSGILIKLSDCGEAVQVATYIS